MYQQREHDGCPEGETLPAQDEPEECRGDDPDHRCYRPPPELVGERPFIHGGVANSTNKANESEQKIHRENAWRARARTELSHDDLLCGERTTDEYSETAV